ncbi:hypothetical protein FACS189413_02400 [Bacteroidia bacterium]|nr:hypothetical protein FACS189463_3520 [Bacteroidia bacterium]GHU67510.1 hypothetical protein FACS189413_02400 [Bacteroidia bacterium]
MIFKWLILKWITTDETLLTWKLTYVFDDQDALFDNIPILGYLDDMLVIFKKSCIFEVAIINSISVIKTDIE